jgi:lysophospholipase L1-like esterase
MKRSKKMLFEEKVTYLLTGDSITDCGRGRPVGESHGGRLGTGYVSLLDSMIQADYPRKNIRLLNTGNGGDTSRALLQRISDDVLGYEPEWVSIMIGINDVWRHFDTPDVKNQLVSIGEYEQNLHEIIKSIKPAVEGLILATPYYIESNKEDQIRVKMDEYGVIVKKLAKAYSLPLVDTQAVFDQYLQNCHSAKIAWDRVHPNQTGHLLIAREFYRVLHSK